MLARKPDSGILWLMPRIAPKIELTEPQRQELQRMLRSMSTSKLETLRARIVLLAAEGHPNDEIASTLEVSQPMVCKWRRRFSKRGMAGLNDSPRSGRPGSLSTDKLNKILTEVTRP